MSHLGRLLHRRHHQIQQQDKQNVAINAFANAFDPVVNAVAEDEGSLDETVVDGNFVAIKAGGTINWDNNGGINGQGGEQPEDANKDGGGGDGNGGANCDVDGIHNSVQDIMRNLIVPKSADSYASNKANFIFWLYNSVHSYLFVDDGFVADFNHLKVMSRRSQGLNHCCSR